MPRPEASNTNTLTDEESLNVRRATPDTALQLKRIRSLGYGGEHNMDVKRTKLGQEVEDYLSRTAAFVRTGLSPPPPMRTPPTASPTTTTTVEEESEILLRQYQAKRLQQAGLDEWVPSTTRWTPTPMASCQPSLHAEPYRLVGDDGEDDGCAREAPHTTLLHHSVAADDISHSILRRAERARAEAVPHRYGPSSPVPLPPATSYHTPPPPPLRPNGERRHTARQDAGPHMVNTPSPSMQRQQRSGADTRRGNSGHRETSPPRAMSVQAYYKRMRGGLRRTPPLPQLS